MSVPLTASLSADEIVRRSGSSFLSSFVFLSPARRRSLSAVYAFCRVVDDAVDLLAPSEAVEALSFWREELLRAFGGSPWTPLGNALASAADEHGLTREPLLEVVAGVEMDLAGTRYRTFQNLAVYCRRVASSVGLACLPIFGARSRESAVFADRLGLALQFTNILRDLVADAAKGRIYLPEEDLDRFGVHPALLRCEGPSLSIAGDWPLTRLLSFEAERARGLFAEAGAALPRQDRRALLPARIMGSVYRELLEKLARAGLAGIREGVRLTRLEKTRAALFTWLFGGGAW